MRISLRSGFLAHSRRLETSFSSASTGTSLRSTLDMVSAGAGAGAGAGVGDELEFPSLTIGSAACDTTGEKDRRCTMPANCSPPHPLAQEKRFARPGKFNSSSLLAKSSAHFSLSQFIKR